MFCLNKRLYTANLPLSVRLKVFIYFPAATVCKGVFKFVMFLFIFSFLILQYFLNIFLKVTYF